MDRRTDGGNYNIPFAFLKKRGDKNIPLCNWTTKQAWHCNIWFNAFSIVYVVCFIQIVQLT